MSPPNNYENLRTKNNDSKLKMQGNVTGQLRVGPLVGGWLGVPGDEKLISAAKMRFLWQTDAHKVQTLDQINFLKKYLLAACPRLWLVGFS